MSEFKARAIKAKFENPDLIPKKSDKKPTQCQEVPQTARERSEQRKQFNEKLKEKETLVLAQEEALRLQREAD